jgi:hypothetical protein
VVIWVWVEAVAPDLIETMCLGDQAVLCQVYLLQVCCAVLHQPLLPSHGIDAIIAEHMCAWLLLLCVPC